MALTIHDPDHVALCRGIRAAVALPLGLAIALYVFDDIAGAVFTVFGSVGLLINADFAGSTVQRLASYLVAGVVTVLVVYLAGWCLAVVICTISAMELLPRNHRADVRAALARAFSAVAKGVEGAWPPPPSAGTSRTCARTPLRIRGTQYCRRSRPGRTPAPSSSPSGSSTGCGI